ncbi:MAG: carbohydrate ABC transporter permease [Clostridiales bacterium]|nr:carbohydrate ABC transporter permease [Clostridiales bacterium]
MTKKGWKKVGFYCLLGIVLVYVLFPFFWMVINSIKDHKDIMNIERILFFKPTLKNYLGAFKNYDMVVPIKNSLIIGFISTGLSLALGLPCAYAIARYKMDKLSAAILFVRVIPAITFLIPWFIVVSKLGITDTFFVVSLSHMILSLPFTVWIMTPFFESIPIELEEAAMIDGCAPFGRFFKVSLPITRSGIITVTIMSFIYSWNNFMYAMVLSGKNTKTVPIAIFNFVGYSFVDWGAMMAAAVAITSPILILSLLTQKYIIKGLTSGAVKG